ncbi:MAG: hypothetical protein KKE51_12310 [Gammaproteobacteria bacterium]|nr:hypothetical protein [Gammaproteobacteria bacterium]MBU1602077.1 hypothetical protein [Gammaproteobacteria bacterium]MBU2434053.1 hypothetical protein [Gammaproteobacteria bacterium]MBU2447877.1 hypothetical protein [Gammaproteobacteria bacterium]
MKFRPTVVALLFVFLCTAEFAGAACNFVQLNNRAPIGQSLRHLKEKLGKSGFSRLPGESAWSFNRDEFRAMNIDAPHADMVFLGTYKFVVFQSNLKYLTKELDAAHVNLTGILDSCAQRLNQECWRDELGNFFEIGINSKETYLYISSPHYGPPDDPDLPPKRCR